ncbi:hypothetical protein [Mycobacteroides abscessus]|uniref:hypothetical protein n=1 Tax=Mycobacteroides abscessus TaxID=36809 RepID=UPI0009423AFC|nr:hypothetical protein [Mycobacteroides abscessus]
MEPIPTAKNPKIPTSQQEAQDTVLRYLQDTLNALPKGSKLDGTRFGDPGSTINCSDDATGPADPVEFSDLRDVIVPAGTESARIVAEIDEVWRRWGWQVLEREGFPKPNRFGYAPDGYVLQIKVRNDPIHSVSMIGTSPCFPGNLRRDDISQPGVITQLPSA